MLVYGLLVTEGNTADLHSAEIGAVPIRSTKYNDYGVLAHLGERFAGSEKAVGSSPTCSTISGLMGRTVRPGHNSLVKHETLIAKCFTKLLDFSRVKVCPQGLKMVVEFIPGIL